MHAPRTANAVDAHLGQRIRSRRTALKMSQMKLGDALGITFQQVQKYEQGKNRIAASRLYVLSQIMEVPIAFFYEGLANLIAAQMSGEVAEGDQVKFSYDVLKTPEGAELAKAFSQIKKKSVRRQVLELARTLAESENE